MIALLACGSEIGEDDSRERLRVVCVCGAGKTEGEGERFLNFSDERPGSAEEDIGEFDVAVEDGGPFLSEPLGKGQATSLVCLNWRGVAGLDAVVDVLKGTGKALEYMPDEGFWDFHGSTA